MIDIRTMPHIVVDDVFTDDEIKEIYRRIDGQIESNIASGQDRYRGFFKVKNNGFLVYTDETFRDIVSDRLKERLSDITGIEVKTIGMHFSRYEAYDGLQPNLMPHLDRHSKNANLTMTVQLQSTLDWSLYVDTEEVKMFNNRGVLFCSNYQLHWRPDKKFGPKDKYDTVLILINQDLPDNPELPDGIFADQTKFHELMSTHGHMLQETIKLHERLAAEATPCTNPNCTIPGCVNGNCEINDYHHDSNSDYHRRDTNRYI